MLFFLYCVSIRRLPRRFASRNDGFLIKIETPGSGFSVFCLAFGFEFEAVGVK